MTTFVIATEAGIKIEVKQNLKKDQVKKLENNFSEVKDFVEDKGDGVVITAQEKYINLSMMLKQETLCDVILVSSNNIENLMEDTIKFIDSLPEDKKISNDTTNVHAEQQNEDNKKFDDIFEMFKKSFSNAGIFMMVYNPEEHGVHFAGNMNKNFVLSALLVDEDS